MVLPAVNPLDSLIKLAKSRGDALVNFSEMVPNSQPCGDAQRMSR